MELIDLIDKLSACVLIIYKCSFFIGMVGNVIACIVLSSSKSFHDLTGSYLLSLSVADLLILLTGVLYILYLSQFEFLLPGKVANYIMDCTFQTSVVVSTLTVTVFTVERYLAICHPFYVQSLSKQSRARNVIVGIWLISCLVALIPLVDNFIVLQFEDEKSKEEAIQYVIDVWSVFVFYIPMLVVTVLYVVIWLQLKKRSNGKQIINRQSDSVNKRTLIMFVIIVAVFFISWAPHYTCRVILGHLALERYGTFTSAEEMRTYMDKMYLIDLGKQFTYSLSPALNPVIYSVVSKKFREAFKVLFNKNIRKLADWTLKLTESSLKSKTLEISHC